MNPKPEQAAIQLNANERHDFINQSANEDFMMPPFENIWDGFEDNQLPGLVTVSQKNLNSGTGMMPGYYGDQLSEIPSNGSISVSPETSGLNYPGTTQQLTGSDVLEDWEKFLDDETSDSCWKSFLE